MTSNNTFKLNVPTPNVEAKFPAVEDGTYVATIRWIDFSGLKQEPQRIRLQYRINQNDEQVNAYQTLFFTQRAQIYVSNLLKAVGLETAEEMTRALETNQSLMDALLGNEVQVRIREGRVVSTFAFDEAFNQMPRVQVTNRMVIPTS